MSSVTAMVTVGRRPQASLQALHTEAKKTYSWSLTNSARLDTISVLVKTDILMGVLLQVESSPGNLHGSKDNNIVGDALRRMGGLGHRFSPHVTFFKGCFFQARVRAKASTDELRFTHRDIPGTEYGLKEGLARAYLDV